MPCNHCLPWILMSSVWLTSVLFLYCPSPSSLVRVCPIFQVSNVTGANLDLLKIFLNLLPARMPYNEDKPPEFQIDETYSVPVSMKCLFSPFCITFGGSACSVVHFSHGIVMIFIRVFFVIIPTLSVYFCLPDATLIGCRDSCVWNLPGGCHPSQRHPSSWPYFPGWVCPHCHQGNPSQKAPSEGSQGRTNCFLCSQAGKLRS